jgi:hypothetical protein
MNGTEHTPEAEQLPGPGLPDAELNIEDLHDFVRLLEAWHGHKVALLHHMLGIPDGTEVIDLDDKPPLVLTGDALRGFQCGLKYALSEIAELPFVTYVDPEEDDEGGEGPQGEGNGSGADATNVAA